MIKVLLTPLIVVLPFVAAAQDVIGFPFGKVNSGELAIKSYPADTSAAAYVMWEFGKAHVSFDDPNKLRFQYHTKIKILKQSAVSQADIRIPLYKQGSEQEVIFRIYASSFNDNGGQVQETKVENKRIFTEKNDKYYNTTTFAIPNVKVGSIIEYQYEIETPFLWNFKNWEFQGDLPKVRSEYHTGIPGNYRYNIVLRGPLPLASHESEIQRECLRGPSGGSADCVWDKYLMKDVPAFKEEEYMISKMNFLAAINFELSEITDWGGQKHKYTKEWDDADQELATASDFGIQLKRGKDVVDGAIDVAVLGETDPLTKAKKIFNFIKFHFAWNEVYGKRSEIGIKKAFDQKKGNVADINLSLIAALRYAGFNCDPVLLATRTLPRPIELHPVLSDFNYVIAKLTLNEKVYLLDAVDDFMPFGQIPMRCYNGIGRVMSPEGSYWMDIKPTDKHRSVTLINLKLETSGTMTGTINITSYGYAAIEKRRAFAGFNDEKSYLEDEKSNNHTYSITNYVRTAEEDMSKPVNERFSIELSAFDAPETKSFLFNPFLARRIESNPFQSDTRNYPIDYGVPQEANTTIVIELPAEIEITSLPEKVGLALPNGGGKYIFGSQVVGNILTLTNVLSIARPLYLSEEYPFLKEIYARFIQTQNSDIIFKKK